jgi:hypothetical protein
MTKVLPKVLTLAIVAFWLVMNGALLRREYEFRGLDAYRQGIVQFLGNDLRRERWLGVYRNGRKLGYTGCVFEKTFADAGIEHRLEIDSRFDILGTGAMVSIEGTIISDFQMAPLTLEATVRTGGAEFRFRGERSPNGFLIRGSAGGLELFSRELPLRELLLGDGIFPMLPVSGFEVGQSYDLPAFDPISQEIAPARVEVRETAQLALNGLKLDCFVLETRFRGLSYRSWMTADGDTLRLEIPAPASLVLKRESRLEATQGFRALPAPLAPAPAPATPTGN